VRLGLRTLESVEILQGLAEGDAVLLGNGVKAGDRVRTRMLATWPVGSASQSAGSGGSGGAALTNAMGR